MSIPKVSIDHQGFCRNNHPHGWDDTEEKTERNIEFMYITTSITQSTNMKHYVVNKSNRNENRAGIHLRNLNRD